MRHAPRREIYDTYNVYSLSKHNVLGRDGEEHACRFLKAQGHVILETNYRFGHKEIDVISMHGDILVFTEIKTRSSTDFGFPEESVTFKKQGFLKIAAENFCRNNPQYLKVRFDVVSLVIKKGQVLELFHIEDAFY